MENLLINHQNDLIHMDNNKTYTEYFYHLPCRFICGLTV